ncbi:hypothetical protein [Propylenella binzhouense]|uniref:Uncharacterized protein n=1 Tax=Propylenella binzhouense TaxID=2555902 RepID=A0A964WTT4_9HYPH|nr:hypothetical protein [Propylenella binzhouense]MYZ48334.1 hypothetical protein [Propylenella binzhouense]
MKTLIIISAAATLFGSAALAQTPPSGAGPSPNLPTPPSTPPAIGSPGSIPEVAPGSDIPDIRRDREQERRIERQDRRDRPGGGDARRGAGFRHGMPPFGMAASEGAFFVFERPGGGRIVAKCADQDSTQACVDAIRPMLQGIIGPDGPRPGPGGGPRPGAPGAPR